jgi:hypothetical protein
MKILCEGIWLKMTEDERNELSDRSNISVRYYNEYVDYINNKYNEFRT